MPISYPLELPSTKFLRQNISTHSVVAVSRSIFTMRSQVQEQQGQMWTMDGALPPLKRDEAEPWLAFFLKLNGMLGTFMAGDVLGKRPQGTGFGNPVVDGSGQSGQTLITRGWNGSTAVLKAGDYFQVGQRLYKVVDDALPTGATGQATLDFWPRLRESPNDGEQLIIVDARGLFRLAGNDSLIVSVDTRHVYDISFSAVEAY